MPTVCELRSPPAEETQTFILKCLFSKGLYTGGVSAAGEETQDRRPGSKRTGHHHGHGTEGTTEAAPTVG